MLCIPDGWSIGARAGAVSSEGVFVAQRFVHSQPRIGARQRAAVVVYAREHGIKRAARHFGWVPQTVRAWVRRWEERGEAGLAPKVPPPRGRRLPEDALALIGAARENGWGAAQTRAWIEGVHHVRVSTRTIQRVFRDIGGKDPDPATAPGPLWPGPVDVTHAADRA
jgi:transposase